MPTNNVRVQVTGLRRLSSALKKVGAETPSELKKGFLDIAEDVASRVRSKVPKRTGRAAASVLARGSTRGASIAAGGTRAPYYPWLDFGGRVGKNKSISRQFIPQGRYIYPTIREESSDIEDEVDKTLKRVCDSVGLDYKGE